MHALCQTSLIEAKPAYARWGGRIGIRRLSGVWRARPTEPVTEQSRRHRPLGSSCPAPAGAALRPARPGSADRVPIYGSGGFTSYDRDQLVAQLAGWADAGFSRVKMKVGTHPDQDVDRVATARSAIGKDVELFVDANGAYSSCARGAEAGRPVRRAGTWSGRGARLLRRSEPACGGAGTTRLQAWRSRLASTAWRGPVGAS